MKIFGLHSGDRTERCKPAHNENGGVEKLVIGQVVRRLSYTENRGIESREKPERNENSNPKWAIRAE